MARKTGLASAKRGLSRFDGIEEMQVKLARLINSSNAPEVKRVFVRMAAIARDDIKALAPVRTGTLRNAVFAGGGRDGETNALVGVNYRKAPHAHLVEFGTPHSAPKPFFRPGLVNATPKMKDALIEGLKQFIEDEARKR